MQNGGCINDNYIQIEVGITLDTILDITLDTILDITLDITDVPDVHQSVTVLIYLFQ